MLCRIRGNKNKRKQKMENQKSATYLDSRQSAAPQHFVMMIAPNGNNNNNNNIHINNGNNNCNT